MISRGGYNRDVKIRGGTNSEEYDDFDAEEILDLEEISEPSTEDLLGLEGTEAPNEKAEESEEEIKEFDFELKKGTRVKIGYYLRTLETPLPPREPGLPRLEDIRHPLLDRVVYSSGSFYKSN
jgi:hypothetical protein